MLQPSPLKRNLVPRLGKNTGPGLILGQDQGRHRGLQGNREKILFHYLRFVYNTLSRFTKLLLWLGLLVHPWLEGLLFRLFSTRVSTNWLLENLDCSRMPTVGYFYRIGVNLLFSRKEETWGSELASSLLSPKLLLLQSGCSIAPYRTWSFFFR